MVSKHSHRKNEHVSLALKFYSDISSSGFNQLRFIHHGIPSLNANEIDYSTSFDGIELDVPFYIEAMTGGSEYTKKLNAKLSKIAKKTGIAMATGSQSVALKDSSQCDSFTIIRNNNPDGILFSNIGASVDKINAQKVVNMLHSNALEVHINTPQELIMPEGNISTNWMNNINDIVHFVDVPVIIKEVGFGMSKETIHKLTSIGVKNINISGRGGTNFAQIENYRRPKQELDYLNDWGQTTVESLFEAYKFRNDINIIASGGVRNALDIVKCLCLGAKAVGIAAPILHSLIRDGEEATIDMIEDFKLGISTIMTLLGAHNIEELSKVKMILSPSLESYLKQRDLFY
jgi:isopentenyl-diphosphate Delta-isomerase